MLPYSRSTIEPAALREAAERAQPKRKEFERLRLEMVRGYAETEGCRRTYLLNYFGEPFQGPCGNRDRCEAGVAEVAGEARDLPFPPGSRVSYKSFGEGQVVHYEGGKVVVLLDEKGYQTLAVDVVLENGLLEAGKS